MVEPEQHIAKADYTWIGFEDHGMLSVSIGFDYGNAGQALGHRAFGLANEKEPDEWRLAHEMGMEYIRRLLLAFGVDSWDKIRGRTVFVTATHTEILRIDPLPTEKGQSFDIKEWAETYSKSTSPVPA